ncbi:major strawberry allergen Fra a 1-3-like [Juglans microcarpa x Juglans regia]|uniref:major strawberry allergen Fra a 1-3-like n=1 Tax=Juglans microcarpa x Juglans regia TaxID=2249226 RepID=UPI001B7F64AA|nr:major strawberry allergen Fra a 1-3-like [Juglans microcarpa x Juglans regia]
MLFKKKRSELTSLQIGNAVIDWEKDFADRQRWVVTTFTQEFSTSVSPAMLFKALILHSHNLVPKLVPQSIKSIEFSQGDGGVGSIKQTNFPEGSHFKYLKHKIDDLDVDNLMCKYTLIEGDVLGDKLQLISCEVKMEASGSGSGSGSACKMTNHYHTKGEFVIKEENIKDGKDKTLGLYKVVEKYLLANPNIYA